MLCSGMEIWRDIPGWEGLYQASSHGRIKSLRRKTPTANRSGPIIRTVPEKILSAAAQRTGYRRVALCRDGQPTHHGVHRLVCSAFHGPPEGAAEAAHLNGVRHHNRPENLMWASRAENASHRYIHGTDGMGERNPRARLTTDDVQAIRSRYGDGEGRAALAREYGHTYQSISQIVKRESWTHI